MNVEFQYRYRDFGNFKRYGSVVFGNESGLLIDDISRSLLQLTGDDETFAAFRLGIPEIFFTDFPYNPSLDWEMHEYCGVSPTDLPINDAQGRDIGDLLSRMKAIAEGRLEAAKSF
ncbi:MAG: hypothetical protein ABSC47_00015 [Terracidiphilus sp.]